MYTDTLSWIVYASGLLMRLGLACRIVSRTGRGPAEWPCPRHALWLNAWLLFSSLVLSNSRQTTTNTTSITFIENPNMKKKSQAEEAVARPPSFSPHPIHIFKDVPLLTRIKGIFGSIQVKLNRQLWWQNVDCHTNELVCCCGNWI